MLTARKYRLYPSDGERELMAQHFGCARFVYNEALAYNQEHYQSKGKFLSAFELTKRLPALKEQHPWLKDVNAQVLQQSLMDLGIAFTRWGKRLAKFPRFKSKHHRHQSCRFPQRPAGRLHRGQGCSSWQGSAESRSTLPILETL